jgi:putative copper export protein
VFFAIDSLVLALRALSFVAIFQAAGNAMFLELFRSSLSPAVEERLRAHARIAAVAALCLAVLHYVLTPARMAGSLGGTFDPALDALLLESNAGGAHIARVVGLALLVLSVERASRLNSIATAGGVALTIASFALMGHTAIHPLRWALAPLLLVHVAVAAFWFGALWPLHVVASAEPAPIARAVVARFSRVALLYVPLIFVCGGLMAVLLIRSFAELFTPYGAIVLGKTLAFGALMMLAALNKWRYGPRLGGADASAVRSLKRTVVAEWVLLALVLAGTALLTALFAPEHLEGTFGPEHEREPEHSAGAAPVGAPGRALFATPAR